MKFNSKILLISLLSIFLLLSIATASAADADIAAVDADVDMDEISDIAIKDGNYDTSQREDFFVYSLPCQYGNI